MTPPYETPFDDLRLSFETLLAVMDSAGVRRKVGQVDAGTVRRVAGELMFYRDLKEARLYMAGHREECAHLLEIACDGWERVSKDPSLSRHITTEIENPPPLLLFCALALNRLDALEQADETDESGG